MRHLLLYYISTCGISSSVSADAAGSPHSARGAGAAHCREDGLHRTYQATEAPEEGQGEWEEGILFIHSPALVAL